MKILVRDEDNSSSIENNLSQRKLVQNGINGTVISFFELTYNFYMSD